MLVVPEVRRSCVSVALEDDSWRRSEDCIYRDCLMAMDDREEEGRH